MHGRRRSRFDSVTGLQRQNRIAPSLVWRWWGHWWGLATGTQSPRWRSLRFQQGDGFRPPAKHRNLGECQDQQGFRHALGTISSGSPQSAHDHQSACRARAPVYTVIAAVSPAQAKLFMSTGAQGTCPTFAAPIETRLAGNTAEWIVERPGSPDMDPRPSIPALTDVKFVQPQASTLGGMGLPRL